MVPMSFEKLSAFSNSLIPSSNNFISLHLVLFSVFFVSILFFISVSYSGLETDMANDEWTIQWSV